MEPATGSFPPALIFHSPLEEAANEGSDQIPATVSEGTDSTTQLDDNWYSYSDVLFASIPRSPNTLIRTRGRVCPSFPVLIDSPGRQNPAQTQAPYYGAQGDAERDVEEKSSAEEDRISNPLIENVPVVGLKKNAVRANTLWTEKLCAITLRKTPLPGLINDKNAPPRAPQIMEVVAFFYCKGIGQANVSRWCKSPEKEYVLPERTQQYQIVRGAVLEILSDASCFAEQKGLIEGILHHLERLGENQPTERMLKVAIDLAKLVNKRVAERLREGRSRRKELIEDLPERAEGTGPVVTRFVPREYLEIECDGGKFYWDLRIQ